MPIFFNDLFTGSGALTAHSPDTPFSGLSWRNDEGGSNGATLSGGYAISTLTTNTNVRGAGQYGVAGTNYGHPTEITVNFSFKTGPDVEPNGDGYNSLTLVVYVGGQEFWVLLQAAPLEVFELSLDNNDELSDSEITFPDANTEYAGTLHITDGLQTLTFMGETRTIASTYVVPGEGFSSVEIAVGHTCGINSLSISDYVLAGTATANLTAPMGGNLRATTGSNVRLFAPMGAVSGVILIRSSAFNGASPMGVLESLTGARGVLTSPAGQMRSVSRDSTGERAFNGVSPMGQLVARTGAAARLTAPMGALVASITVPISVRAELTGPTGALLTSGTVSVSVTADLRLSSAGTVQAFSGGTVRLTGPMSALQAVATAGVLARFAATAPMGDLNALATAGIVVRAELLSPMLRPTDRMTALLVAPMGSLTAVARAVVAVVYEAYAVNLKPGSKMPNQVTRYTNYPFNQIVRFQNKYIGVADDGLYLLGGATDYDDTTPAGPAWAWHTAITDFNSPQKKNVREAVFSGRLGPKATASVSVREAADTTYAATIVRGTAAQNHRIKYGRGLSARYWSFGLADADGGECDVDRVEFDAAELGRKL
jgi:hypothetical protein